MQVIAILLIAAAVFGVCRLVDSAFTKLFRSKAQHRSGKAIRANKRYGSFGIILIILGLLAIFLESSLLIPGIVVMLMGGCMVAHYLGYGIFYDDESFLVSGLLRRSKVYAYKDIRCQQLYAVTGGNTVVELRMHNGETVSLQSQMAGVYDFLDTAFLNWCRQKGIDPENCGFSHDPGSSCWFPSEEEV